jgi:hypothetical protein
MFIMACNLAFFHGDGLSLDAFVSYAVAGSLGWATFSLMKISLFEGWLLGYQTIYGAYNSLSIVCTDPIIEVWR